MADYRTQINANKRRFSFVPFPLCPFVIKIPLLLLAFLLLVACGETAVSPPPPTAPPIAALPETATPTQTATLAPTATPTITPSPTATSTPTATPTATPRPTLAVSVPAVWLDEVNALLAAHNGTDTRWQWQAVDAAYPAAAAAPIALVNNAEGVIVAQEPLVVTVPFNHSWTFTTLADAEGMIANGHSLARAMPWSAMPPTQRPLRVDGLQPDDPTYPLHVSWSLLAEGEGWETAVAELAPLLEPLLAPEPVIKVAAVGDINLDRWLGNAIRQGYIDWPFVNVAPIFQSADLAIGNLETALGDTGEPQPKNYTFQSPPDSAITLANAGFDVLSLANNHALDYGEESLLQGIDLLTEQGVAVVGAGENAAAARAPYIAEVNGLRVAFLGYVHVPVEVTSHFDTATWTATADTPGLAWAVPEEIAEDVTAVLPYADLVVVMLHSGYEYVIPPSEEQKAAAYAAIDAGAHLVVGHHAHILQGVQFYKGGVIAFGLGNFAFNIDGEPNSVILNVWMDRNGVRQLEFIPTIVQSDGQPRLATPEEADVIFRQIYDRSRAFPVP